MFRRLELWCDRNFSSILMFLVGIGVGGCVTMLVQAGIDKCPGVGG